MTHLVAGVPGMAALGVLIVVVVAEAVLVPGVFLPGATGVLAGSALVAAGRVPAGLGVPVLAATVLAADQAAFAAGRWLSAAAAHHIDINVPCSWGSRGLRAVRQKALSQQGGGRSGRLSRLARAGFPSLAGATGLQYRRFLPTIVGLRVIWLPMLIGAGLLAGRGLGTVEHLAAPVGVAAGAVALTLAPRGPCPSGADAGLAWRTGAARGPGRDCGPGGGRQSKTAWHTRNSPGSTQAWLT